MPLRNQVAAAVTTQFRTTAEIAVDADVTEQQAAPVLAHMRRAGTIEWRQHRELSLWRRPVQPPI